MHLSAESNNSTHENTSRHFLTTGTRALRRFFDSCERCSHEDCDDSRTLTNAEVDSELNEAEQIVLMQANKRKMLAGEQTTTFRTTIMHAAQFNVISLQNVESLDWPCCRAVRVGVVRLNICIR
jgi:hypothetical protein